MVDGDTTRRTNDSAAVSADARVLVLRWVGEGSLTTNVIESARIVIGRGDECDVRLSGDGVSRKHAELHRQGPIYALRDLGSRNGTFLNGKRAAHAPIAAGDILRIGSNVGVFAQVEQSRAHLGFERLAASLFGGPELDLALEPAHVAATTELPIIIMGATGTGKERVAEAIHEWSGRTGEFHAVNCAALPTPLAEAELFGHRRGAFTGADRDGVGHVRAADGGTLLLDEIADLPLPVQAKLLRVVENRQVTPLGDTKAVAVNVRIVAAFQRPVRDLVSAGLFREDFASRLSGIHVELPPLSARRGDIPPLFREFLRMHSGGRAPRADHKVVESLCLYPWPRHVRELEQVARQMLVMHGLEALLRRSHLPKHITASISALDEVAPVTDPDESRRNYDLRRLVTELRENGGNIKAAAKTLRFSRQRAYRLMDGRSARELLSDASLASVRTNHGGSE